MKFPKMSEEEIDRFFEQVMSDEDERLLDTDISEAELIRYLAGHPMPEGMRNRVEAALDADPSLAEGLVKKKSPQSHELASEPQNIVPFPTTNVRLPIKFAAAAATGTEIPFELGILSKDFDGDGQTLRIQFDDPRAAGKSVRLRVGDWISDISEIKEKRPGKPAMAKISIPEDELSELEKSGEELVLEFVDAP